MQPPTSNANESSTTAERLKQYENIVSEGRALPCFRRDLLITRKEKSKGGKFFIIHDPISGEQYEFNEEAFFLCQSFDGVSSSNKIVARFNHYFGKSITTSDLSRFFHQALGIGLLETDQNSNAGYEKLFQETILDSDDDQDRTDANVKDRERSHLTSFNPERGFILLNTAFRPFRLVFLLTAYSLILTVPIGLFALFDNQYAISQDLKLLGESRTYLGRLVLTLVLINLCRCIVQGTVCTYYGGKIKKFGIRLRFGIIPRFFIEKSAIRYFDRSSKLWSYGSNHLFRLSLFVIGILVWYGSRGSGTQLAGNAITVAHAALIGFFIVILPVRGSDGYRWFTTYFGLPANLIHVAVLIFLSSLLGRPLPTSISKAQRRRYFAYGLLVVIGLSLLIFKIAYHVASGLTASFPNLFGEATAYLILGLVFLLVFRWIFGRFFKDTMTNRNSSFSGVGPYSLPESRNLQSENNTTKKQSITRALLFLAIGIILLLPYPYRPVGEVTLIPPEQQSIQAPVSGKVVEVFYKGGDGIRIQQSSIVAKMLATDIEHQILTLKEQILKEQATQKSYQANLNKLQAGPRQEEIDVANVRVAEATKEVDVAKGQLETSKLSATYSQQNYDMVNKLTNVIAAIDILNAKRQADIDRYTIVENQSNLEAKQKYLEQAKAELKLLVSGPRVEDIEAARQAMEAARAEVRRLQQELEYVTAQVSKTRLVMPINGYLIDSYLMQKVGRYLNQGDTFATAQAGNKPIAELELAEYDAVDIPIGSSAEIKLMAHPNRPLMGRVISVEPQGSEDIIGQIFKVLIELDDPDVPIKTGMSGYGKIIMDKRPIFELLARPIVRFVLIEVWSWMP